MCTCITESLYRTAETNTMFLINSTPMQNEKALKSLLDKIKRKYSVC